MYNLNFNVMGKFNDGIFGSFSGRVGNVVGANWRGIDVLRKRPRKKPGRVGTASQLEQRAKFSMIIQFLNPIKEVAGTYFSKETKTKSRFNLATGYNLKNALIDGPGNTFTLDFSKVLISKGELRGLEGGALAAAAGQVLDLSWTDNSGQGSAAATDLVLAVVYSPSLDLFQMYNPSTAVRGDASVQLTLPAYYNATEVHVWATVVSSDKKVAAVSTYMGTVTVT
jgi:hypothetical protein